MDKSLRPRNFPMWLLEDLFKVASMGEEKYGTYDYLEKDYTVNDHLDAAKRHLMRYENPFEDDLDHESRVSHLYHTAWRCLVAAHVQKRKPELDDRYKPIMRPEEVEKIIDDINEKLSIPKELLDKANEEYAKGLDILSKADGTTTIAVPKYFDDGVFDD